MRLASSPPTTATRPSAYLRLLLRTYRDVGGETIAEVRMSDGSQQVLTAGQGSSVGAGLILDAAPWVLEATIGFKTAAVGLSNGLIDLSRSLVVRRIAVTDLDDIVVGRFLAKRRRTHTQFVSGRALEPLLGFLVDHDVLTKSSPLAPPRSGRSCRV